MNKKANQFKSKNKNKNGNNSGNDKLKNKNHLKQMIEKYKNMAKDKKLNGEPIEAERALQYMDHYQKMMNLYFPQPEEAKEEIIENNENTPQSSHKPKDDTVVIEGEIDETPSSVADNKETKKDNNTKEKTNKTKKKEKTAGKKNDSSDEPISLSNSETPPSETKKTSARRKKTVAKPKEQQLDLGTEE